ncbi:DUF4185 domain-containing protein [Roseiconus nitratireducens]|nr:DUF4185 domain-containing protein [Roseiconus nitratireducens]
MKRIACVIGSLLVLVASGILAPCSADAQQPPYPPSAVIAGVEFDFTTHRRLATGSDNWPVTWADDGHLYAAWGDGGGFGGSNSKGRVKLGVARIEGDADGYVGVNVWGGFQPRHPAQFDGKSYGMLCIDGVLWMWVAGQPARHMKSCAIAKSTDHAATWERAGWTFAFEDGLSVPTFLNFGQDYAGARDDFVYSYLIEPTWGPDSLPQTAHGFDVHQPGRIHLARVPRQSILQRERYEFFSGFAADGSAQWSPDIGKKRPVFEDPEGVGWNVSVIYNAGLNRYLLCTEHSQSHAGKLGIFDAPQPWGPWTTIAYEDAWGDGQVEVSTFFWNFTQKWISDDGARFTMIFTGKNTNDSWNTVQGKFVLHSPE